MSYPMAPVPPMLASPPHLMALAGASRQEEMVSRQEEMETALIFPLHLHPPHPQLPSARQREESSLVTVFCRVC